MAEIGRIVGAHESTVRLGLRRAGIGNSPRVPEAAYIEQIGELNGQGLSIRKIETATGWARGSVMKAIRLYGEQIAGSGEIQQDVP